MVKETSLITSNPELNRIVITLIIMMVAGLIAYIFRRKTSGITDHQYREMTKENKRSHDISMFTLFISTLVFLISLSFALPIYMFKLLTSSFG